MIRAVEDVEETLAHEQVERLIPARIEMDDAGVGVHVQHAFGLAGLQEAQAEMEKLEEDLKNYVDGSQPLTWVIG